MKIYTKTGDAGTTNLAHTKNITKSDARLEVIGSMEELTSHIGLIKTKIHEEAVNFFLEEIQHTLTMITAGVSDSYNRKYKLKEEAAIELEKEMDRLENLFECPNQSVLPGMNPLSAEIDVARAVARRAERCLAAVSVKFGCDTGAKRYMNRLADYLYMLARYYDVKMEGGNRSNVEPGKEAEQSVAVKTMPMHSAETQTGGNSNMEQNTGIDEALIQKVLMRMGQGKMTLELSKKLIQKIEEEAERRGKKAVIAICGPDGNPIAVHVMDGAFLVSFDVAVRKAYTSVAVKMSTMELSKLTQPGQTFYGLESLDGGKLVIFGGGVPLVCNGNIIGGLGISGGTGEEDHSLAEYALSILPEILS